MKIELKLKAERLIILTTALQPVYNSKALTRMEKSALSIALDVVTKIESKANSLKGKVSLFDVNKKHKITLKYHEAYALEFLLIDQIKNCEIGFIVNQIQTTINELNQKLA